MTLDEAMREAVTGNPGLQATLQEVGISRADLVTAGQIKNPILSGSARFPDRSGLILNTEYGISIDLLDLMLRPLRRKLAGTALEQARARVAEAVAQVQSQAAAAWYDLAAQQQTVRLEQTTLDASQAASGLAQRQFAAGNISMLDLGRQEAETAAVQVDLVQAQGALQQARNRLGLVLGRNTGSGLQAAGDLPDLPARDEDEPGLEQEALHRRALLTAVRLEPRRLQQSLSLQRREAGLGAVRLGFDRETETNGVSETGPTLQVAIPIFNHNQGPIQRLQAQLRQSQLQVTAAEQQVRLEVQNAFSRTQVARQRVDVDATELVPLRTRILEQSQLYYNNMQQSVFMLLSDRQAEARARSALIEARRDYWVASAELARATGRLQPGPAGTAPAPGAQTK